MEELIILLFVPFVIGMIMFFYTQFSNYHYEVVLGTINNNIDAYIESKDRHYIDKSYLYLFENKYNLRKKDFNYILNIIQYVDNSVDNKGYLNGIKNY